MAYEHFRRYKSKNQKNEMFPTSETLEIFVLVETKHIWKNSLKYFEVSNIDMFQGNEHGVI